MTKQEQHLLRGRIERFRAKWVLVRVKKARQNKKLEPGFDSIKAGKALVRALLAGTALAFAPLALSTTLPLGAVLSSLIATPALAAGGAGGGSGGGAGGIDNPTGVGGTGGAGTGKFGGGGGGAGITGGAGGDGSGGLGGAGGVAGVGGGDGGDGGNATTADASGGGGGGGAAGVVGNDLPTTASTGGRGGRGGDGGVNARGGGSGAGGYGAVVTGTGDLGVLGVAVTGGAGGGGGGFDIGGDGGDGGVGLFGNSLIFIISATGSVVGGNGGDGGQGGNGGKGGAGIFGDDLMLTIMGAVSGGNGGGAAFGTGDGGAGGAGISGDGLTLTIDGAVAGGNGYEGTAGGGVAGNGGAGGAGIAGDNLSLSLAATATVSGGLGGSGNSAGTQGGAGGAGGAAIAGNNLTGTVDGTVTGGKGGGGGDAGLHGGAGGAGGSGLTGNSSTLTIIGTVVGGDGGTGGGNCCRGADGGAGGAGIAGDNLTLTIAGTVEGGNGGGGGTGGSINGSKGAGGAGIIGQDLAITLGSNGSVVGGLGSAQANAIAFTGGSNSLTFGNATSGLTGGIDVAGSLTFDQNNGVDATVANVISGSGSVIKSGADTVTLSGTNTYTGDTTFQAGTLSVSQEANLGGIAGGLTFNGGVLRVTGAAFSTTVRSIDWQSGGGGFDIADPSHTFTVSQDLGGTGSLAKLGGGTLILSGANTYAGRTTVDAGTLQAGAGNTFSASSAHVVASGATLDLNGFDQKIGSLSGAGTITNSGTNVVVLTTGNDNSSTTFSGVIENGASALALTQWGTGTFTLSGLNNTYTGGTTVNAGTLLVNGAIVSDTTVNAGGTFGGTGTAGSVTVNANGVFAPGDGTPNSHMGVSGTLDFSGGGTYRVFVNPTTASFADLAGTATLTNGTVNAVFSPGSYVFKRYTILTAGALNGTFNPAVTTTGLPADMAARLSYDANDVYLNLTLPFAVPGGLDGNQQSVADALTNFFDSNGGIPGVFTALTADQLTQASGEGGADTTQSAFGASNLFMNLLLDPFNDGHLGSSTGGGAIGYASEPDAEALDAYAAVTPKDRRPAVPFDRRWSLWASGYGGSASVSGNAATGTHDTTNHIYGMAAGADYRLSPDTLLGFALGGAGFNFDLSDGLGSGRADLFQAGVYGRRWFGPAYVAGALAYGWQDVKTDRRVTISGTDQLEAGFKAQTFAARGEAGYRYATPWGGITPYGALQATSFHLPSYAEDATSGSDTFALSYDSQTTTNWRTELGARFDKSFLLADGVLTLRSRLAWAHDSDTDRPVTAAFQTLPGAAFTVNGAEPAADSALVSAGAEMRWTNGFALAGTFEGEFSETTQSYTEKARLGYAW